MNRWHLASVGDRRRLQLAHSVPWEAFPEQTESPLNCLHMDLPLGEFFSQSAIGVSEAHTLDFLRSQRDYTWRLQGHLQTQPR